MYKTAAQRAANHRLQAAERAVARATREAAEAQLLADADQRRARLFGFDTWEQYQASFATPEAQSSEVRSLLRERATIDRRLAELNALPAHPFSHATPLVASH